MASTKKLTTDQIVQRFKKNRKDEGKFYDYSQVNYVNYFTKVKIICPLHGEFYQLPSEHSKDCTGCKECEKIKLKNTWDEKTKVSGYKHNTSLDTEELISRFEQKRVDKGKFYDYSQVEYVNKYTLIKIICPLHGEFYQKPFSHVQGCTGCKKCVEIKKNGTPHQKKLPTTQDIIQRIKRRRKDNGEFYDYSCVEFVDYTTDIKIICPFHGEFHQNPISHIKGSTKCEKCLIINRRKNKNKKPEPRLTTEIVIQRFEENREDNGKFYDYSQVEYVGSSKKIKIICPLHGEFFQLPKDHIRGHDGCKKCSEEKRKFTNLQKYGTECVLQNEEVKQKIKQTNLDRYGVDNPSLCPEIHQKKIETSLRNFGVEYSTQSEEIREKAKRTNLEKYGVTSPMKIPEIAQKSVETRIKNNCYGISNSSNECRNFIKNYISEKGYDILQCAFSDVENNLYEWGYNVNGRWILYDLVVFEPSHRGNREKIIEILEYHGPFHYTEKDVKERGNEKATPWASSKRTIKESYEIDKLKEEFAKSLTMNYNIIWSNKYHSK